MVKVRIVTEIAASPTEVRAIVLDFPRYSEWHKSMIQSINTDPSWTESSILPGTPLRAKMNGVKPVMVVKVNSADEFSWYGSAMGGAFAGRHYFQFLESKLTLEGTTFVHGEDYDGWMTWMFSEGVLGIWRKKAVSLFTGFSKDLKLRAEALHVQREEFAKAERETMAKL